MSGDGVILESEIVSRGFINRRGFEFPLGRLLPSYSVGREEEYFSARSPWKSPTGAQHGASSMPVGQRGGPTQNFTRVYLEKKGIEKTNREVSGV